MKPARPAQAPELDGGLAWLNVDRPLSLAELRGSVVVLDFWTYCCINCMHVLPTLRALEERHTGDPVVVIGVHSGKFSAERDPARIREAIGRYGVQHPVVVDDDMAIWGRYGIRSWPTLVVIRPDGTIAAVAPGEPELEVLDAFVERELAAARETGALAREAPRLHERPPPAHSPLNYPGKVSPLPDGRFVVSDSGHHRLLLCAGDGQVLATFGSGLRGHVDGAGAAAAFDDPQGACFFDGAVYVADSRNHVVRKLDLERGTVSTVAGTGELGLGPPRQPAAGLRPDAPGPSASPARETALRSPWDLAAVGECLYVAMAGSHQLYRYWPALDRIEAYAGTGVEALIDGPVERSAWAQPSGLSAREGVLYVADSETSAVRAVDLQKGTVDTLVGEGLFDFGDDDGPLDGALLQHALGVAAVPGGVVVADTYNGKLKLLTLAGRNAGLRTVQSGLREPGSVALAPDGTWLVADTNAHRVIRVKNGTMVELSIQGAPEALRGPVAPPAERRAPRFPVEGWFTALLELPEGQGLAPGSGEVVLGLEAAEGAELSAGAPIRVSLEVSRRSDLLLLERDAFTVEAEGGQRQRVTIAVGVEALPEARVEAELVATLDYVACDAKDHAFCVPGRVQVRVPVRLLAAGTPRLELAVPLPELEP